jgi:hypothetical protein
MRNLRAWLWTTALTGLAATAAAQQLPSLPASPPPVLPAEAAASPPILPEVTAKPAADAPIEGYSFGDAPQSLLFTPSQIAMMRTVLTHAESRLQAAPSAEAAPTPDLSKLLGLSQPEKIDEPAVYPSFYLASIFYRTAQDWAVWINGQRIAPQTNNGEITVVGIAPDRAKFSWRPAYFAAISRRAAENRFAPVDKVKHKLTPRDTVVIDNGHGEVLFELKPNQTFAAAYMNTFEGKIEAATPPSVAAPKSFSDKLGDAASAVLNDMGGPPTSPPAPPPAAPPAPSGAAPGMAPPASSHQP